MTDFDFTTYPDAQLEAIAGSTQGPDQRGAAKAELTKRQRDYEMSMAKAEARRQVLRKQFDERLENERQAHAERLINLQQSHAEKLVKMQQDHADKLTQLQLRPAESSAAATKSAAWAAGFSALGTVIAAIFAILTYFNQDGVAHAKHPILTKVAAPISER